MIVRNRGIYRIRKSLGVVRRLFTPLSLSPYQWTMMETGLLDTNGAAAGSGDSISVVQNLGSGASNYLQDTGQDQPKYHTTKGIYLPGVDGNHGSVASLGYGYSDPQTYRVDFSVNSIDTGYIIATRDDTVGGLSVLLSGSGSLFVYKNASILGTSSGGLIALGTDYSMVLSYDGAGDYVLYLDGVSVLTGSTDSSGWDTTTDLFIGARGDGSGSSTLSLHGTITRVSAYASALAPAGLDAASPVFDIDFTIQRHNATSITPSVGGTVSISQSGNDPATVVEYPFVRLDGANSYFKGTLPALDGGYMFCLFSVVGDGGDASARPFSAAPTGSGGAGSNGALVINRISSDKTRVFIGGSGTVMLRTGGYVGTGLHEVRLKTGAHKSLLNGAGELTDTTATTFNLQDFALGADTDGANTAAIDVFVHGLFDKDISDANATKTRDYVIAKRPNLLP
jgi:hypothetical protein